MSVMSWEEARAALQELTSILQQEDGEREALLEVQGLQRQLVDGLNAEHDDVRDAIRGLATRVEGAASEARRTEEFSKIQADIEAIEAQRAELLAAIERTSHARDVSVERVRSLQTEAADVLRAVTEVRRRLDDEVPYLKYHLSLMAAITHMTWDAEAAPRLKGVIAPPPPGQAAAFDFDPTPLSSTEVADRLWGLLAAATTGDVAPRTD